MKLTVHVIAALVLAASTAAWAQDRAAQPASERRGGERPADAAQRPSRPARSDPMLESFYAPEVVMRRREDIGLKDDQQAALKAEMDKTMPQFQQLQERLQGEMEKLTPLIKADHVDEQAVLAQSDKVTGLENEIKRLRLVMLIKVKNILTADQQAKLREPAKQEAPKAATTGLRSDRGTR